MNGHSIKYIIDCPEMNDQLKKEWMNLRDKSGMRLTGRLKMPLRDQILMQRLCKRNQGVKVKNKIQSRKRQMYPRMSDQLQQLMKLF